MFTACRMFVSMGFAAGSVDGVLDPNNPETQELKVPEDLPGSAATGGGAGVLAAATAARGGAK
jgi:hypothetical protein